MQKKMLIDAAREQETRVVVLEDGVLAEYDFEHANQKTLKGNIYLGKVTRVEPSLQACFVDYGGNRHGFLAFSEIHPDYFQIPVADRQKLMEEVNAIADSSDEETKKADKPADENVPDEEDIEQLQERRRAKLLKRMTRNYKIQEVIKKNQILLIQVNKEERGNKGAALTTYLSLAGRYCVLMPNTRNGGGVSRKIGTSADRKRLKSIIDGLNVSKVMSIIIRTAGAKCTKVEIKRDFSYLTKLWDQIREGTLKATAPELIYEEADIIKRAMRDVYTKDIEEILVEGDEGFKSTKAFMKMLTPSHVKKVQEYTDKVAPIFHKFNIEELLDEIHTATVQLPSGGYLVINPTEALVSIDVNSGRSTKERDIEKTALKTNLEAAEEVARQMRLRDLSGLVVIDFIDMVDRQNNRKVEKCMRDCLRLDRARVQSSRISDFGLMEISRQRLRPSISDVSMITCPTCEGIGKIRSYASTASHILTRLTHIGLNKTAKHVKISIPHQVAVALFNIYRRSLIQLEERYEITVEIEQDEGLYSPPFHRLTDENGKDITAVPRQNQSQQGRGGRRGRNRGRNRDRHQNQEAKAEENASRSSSQQDQQEPESKPEKADKKAEGDTHSGNQKRTGKRGLYGRRKSRDDRDTRAEKQNKTSEKAEEKQVQKPTASVANDSKDEKKEKASKPKKAAKKSSETKSEAKSAKKPDKKGTKAATKKAAAKKVDDNVQVISGTPDKPKSGWWDRSSA